MFSKYEVLSKKTFFSINKEEEMLCKPKCLSDICLLPPRRQGALRFSELMRKAHPWVLAPRTMMESIFPWKFSLRRHKVRGGMNDNFLEGFNQGRYGECGRLDLSFKKGGKNQQPNTSLLTLYIYIFFLNSSFSLLSWFWYLQSFSLMIQC